MRGDGAVPALSTEQILQLLTNGEIEVEGLIPWSSNATLLVTVRRGDLDALAVYKPQRGERPLWDFPHGTLGMREVASYWVCRALGWDLVPPTVLREGPHGLGSLQWFVDAEKDAHFFTIEAEPAYANDLKRLAALDIILNNADRKAGHCLVGHDGRLWAIDNALTFHVEYKLRTVIWNFVGQPLPLDLVTDLQALEARLSEDSTMGPALMQLISEAEVAAFCRRLRQLTAAGRYPEPGPGYPVPFPSV